MHAIIYILLWNSLSGKKETWVKSSVDHPMPIFYSLKSILLLFNGNYFEVEGVDVRAIGKKLSDYLQVRHDIEHVRE